MPAAIAAMGVAAGVWAQSITYDPASGLLTIPSVAVGSATYVDVQLLNVGDYRFVLRQAVPQATGTAALASYDAASGLLTLPDVTAGGAMFAVVMLRNVGEYTFTVESAVPRPPGPPYDPYPRAN